MEVIVDMLSKKALVPFFVACGAEHEYASNTGGSKLRGNNSGYL